MMASSGHTRLVLASASPRRRLLLREAGFDAELDPPDVDDADLVCGHAAPREWVAAMAWFKARRVAERRSDRDDELILAADTICEQDGEIFGKPLNQAEARRMLQTMRDRDHRVLTAVCLLGSDGEQRRLFVDETIVSVGELSDQTINDYVDTGDWQGKAGGYNLSERLAAGWPVQCSGDPTSVMGLPMKRLLPLLVAILQQTPTGSDSIGSER
jgi:septum formation protein